MLDFSAALDELQLECIDPDIDGDFIVEFLAPFFPDLQANELRAVLLNVIAVEGGGRRVRMTQATSLDALTSDI